MSCAVSPSTNRPYGVARVCEEWAIPRSSFYVSRKRASSPARQPRKRGPKTRLSDKQLTQRIRWVIKSSPFVGEGYRKVWARLRHQRGVRVGKDRVLRLMRKAELLAPPRRKRSLGPRNHDGTITTNHPDVMWGTDATTTYTRRNGWVTVFVAVDHATSECVGIHAAKPGTRFEALEPVRQGVRRSFGDFHAAVATGLQLRHDHGSQYTSDHFQDELGFLGIESSPAFVRSPEGNGCVERFIRTLKEQLLWLRPFEDVEELRQALHAWAELYNERWLVQRHGHCSPNEARRRLLATAHAA